MEQIDHTNERWKDIPGYEGMYQVSNLGRVKSMARVICNGKGYYLSKEKILKPNVLAKGYLQVELQKNRKRHCLQVHRIVAATFIDNPHKDLYNQVNHLNGNKQDNRVWNLEWCNNSINQLHAWRIGLQTISGKAGRPRRKVILSKDGNDLIFNCVADASRFLGKGTRANLNKVLHKEKHYHTIKGYKANYYE